MKHSIHAVSLYVLIATAALGADECRDPKLRDAILNMVDEDQKARAGGPGHMLSEAEATEMRRVDAVHAKRVREIVDEVGWPGISLVGSDGAKGMWLLVQHFDLAEQDRYLPLMEKAVAQKEALPRHFAYLVDRVRIGHHQKQLYGTQYRIVKEGEWVREPIEDPEHVDARRKTMGLQPLLEYEKREPGGNPRVRW